MNLTILHKTRGHLFRPGLLAAAALAVCAVTGGCDGGPGTDSAPAPPLHFEGLDADARAQLTAAQARAEAEPGSAQTVARFARLLHAYQQLQPAAAYYRRARRLAPDDFELAYLHGLVLRKIGARDEAIAAFRDARDENPTYVPTLLALAELLADAGDTQASVGYYEAVLRAAPDLPRALLGLGQLKQADDPQAALALMRRAATVSGSYGAAHYAIAQVLRDGGDLDGARAELEAFERHRSQAPYLNDPVLGKVQRLNLSRQGHLQRAVNAYGAGKLEVAAREFEKSLEKDPANTNARQNLIAVYGQLGRFEEAEAQYLLAVKANPEIVQLHTNYAMLQIKRKNFAKAIEAYKTAIAVDPGFGKSYLGIGAIYAKQGDHEAALKWYRAALEHDPQNRQARQYLGSAMIQHGAYQEAIATLQPATEPDDLPSAVYLRSLAQAQAAAGRLDEAERSLVRAEALARRFKRDDLARAAQQGIGKLRAARTMSERP